MKVDDKPAKDIYIERERERSIYLILIHEFHVIELRIEMNVCDPYSF